MSRQTVQSIGAAVPGLGQIVETRHAPVEQAVICSPETGGRVSESEKNKTQPEE